MSFWFGNGRKGLGSDCGSLSFLASSLARGRTHIHTTFSILCGCTRISSSQMDVRTAFSVGRASWIPVPGKLQHMRCLKSQFAQSSGMFGKLHDIIFPTSGPTGRNQFPSFRSLNLQHPTPSESCSHQVAALRARAGHGSSLSHVSFVCSSLKPPKRIEGEDLLQSECKASTMGVISIGQGQGPKA